MEKYFLARGTLLEPLIHRWPAWWMTTAPVPAALHLARFQIPLLKSYLKAPEIHERAAADPSLSGGSFIAISPAQREDVAALLRKHLTERTASLALAEAFVQFQEVLVAEAKGGPLQTFYGRLPGPLRGMVELVYDYLNRPSLQLLEPLTYRGPAHQVELQSFRLKILERDCERGSWLTTPRLEGSEALDFRVPFRDQRVDQLFAFDLTPGTAANFCDLIGQDLPRSEIESLLEARPRTFQRWNAAGTRLRYFGHATILIESKTTTILVDPLISPVPSSGEVRWSFADLPEQLDYVLITHAHADHFSLETLLRLRHRIRCLIVPRSMGHLVGDASLALLARELGFQNVIEFETLSSLAFSDGEILGVPFLGEHGDLAHAKVAYLIRLDNHKFLCAADSACVDEEVYRAIRKLVGPIQTVFLNTETQGAPLTFSLEALFPKARDRRYDRERLSRGSTADEGLRLADVLGAERLFNYAMGLEPWLEHITGHVALDSDRINDSDRLIREATYRGIAAQRLRGPTEIVIA